MTVIKMTFEEMEARVRLGNAIQSSIHEANVRLEKKIATDLYEKLTAVVLNREQGRFVVHRLVNNIR